MAPTITLYKRQKQLIVEAPPQGPGAPPEVITMTAATGGWEYGGTNIIARGLPAGKWLITDDPLMSRRWNYFGLFYRDGKINDQFIHGGIWRNGIRFGFHDQDGSHGCVMTRPDSLRSAESKAAAQANWNRTQELIRAAGTRVIKYKNDSDPRRSDPNIYTLRAYFDLVVKEF